MPSHDAGNADLPEDIRQVWTASIGSGSAYRKQVTSTPVVAGDTVYTMDSQAVVSAFRVSDGRQLWQTKTKPKKSRSTNIGGGVGYADGVVYASTGFSEVLALNADSGAIKWRHSLNTPARSAPTIARLGNNTAMLFLTTIDQELLALVAEGRQAPVEPTTAPRWIPPCSVSRPPPIRPISC